MKKDKLLYKILITISVILFFYGILGLILGLIEHLRASRLNFGIVFSILSTPFVFSALLGFISIKHPKLWALISALIFIVLSFLLQILFLYLAYFDYLNFLDYFYFLDLTYFTDIMSLLMFLINACIPMCLITYFMGLVKYYVRHKKINMKNFDKE